MSALRANSLTELNLSNKMLMAPEGLVLAGLIDVDAIRPLEPDEGGARHNAQPSQASRLRTLDLCFNGIDATAAGALARAVDVAAPALTRFDVRHNNLDAEAQRALHTVAARRGNIGHGGLQVLT